jgi:hypothetical protein
MAGTYEDPTNARGVIPWYLFNTTDASTHIAEFLETYNSSFGGIGSSLYTTADWTAKCSNPANVFIGAPTFVGCLLYHNVTRNVINGSLPADLTDIGFTSTAVGLQVRSEITTCLATSCAGLDYCASTSACDVGSLLTNGFELSSQGVAQCWLTLCSGNTWGVDQDMAGIGVCIFQSDVIICNRCLILIRVDILDCGVIHHTEHHCYCRLLGTCCTHISSLSQARLLSAISSPCFQNKHRKKPSQTIAWSHRAL